MAIQNITGRIDDFEYTGWGVDYVDAYVDYVITIDTITMLSTFTAKIYVKSNDSSINKLYIKSSGDCYFRLIVRDYYNTNKRYIIPTQTVNVSTSTYTLLDTVVFEDLNFYYYSDTEFSESHRFICGLGFDRYEDSSDSHCSMLASGALVDYNENTLDINLASTIFCSSAYIGDAARITIARQKTGTTHTITYSFGSLSGTITTKTSNTSINWTIPASFANQIGSTQNQKVGTLTCETFSGNTSLGTSTCQFTVFAASIGSAPTLNPSVLDINPKTIVLTGNANILVRYYSTASYSINAAGKDGAAIVSQQVQNGSITLNNQGHGEIPNVDSNVFDFTVSDSRGLSSTAKITKTWIPYIRLSCSQKVAMELSGETGAKATITISGNYFRGSFGATSNTLKLELRQTDNNGNWGNWFVATNFFDVEYYDNGTYKLDFTTDDLRYDIPYTFQCRATDKLGTVTTSEYVFRVAPVFDWSENDFNFNVPVTIQGGKVYTGETLIDSSTAGTVTLPEPISNFDYVEIYYTDNNGRGGNIARIYGNTTVDLSLVEASSATSTYIRRTAYICSNNTLTPNTTTAGYVHINGTSVSHTAGTNYIRIAKVIGYR